MAGNKPDDDGKPHKRHDLDDSGTADPALSCLHIAQATTVQLHREYTRQRASNSNAPEHVFAKENNFIAWSREHRRLENLKRP